MFFVVQVILALTIQATLISLLFTCKTKETRHALNSNNCENPLKHLKSKNWKLTKFYMVLSFYKCNSCLGF